MFFVLRETLGLSTEVNVQSLIEAGEWGHEVVREAGHTSSFIWD